MLKDSKKIKRVISAILASYVFCGASMALAINITETKPQTVSYHSDKERIENKDNLPQHIVFKHGDISWLPQLAAKAGWPQKTWKRLGNIILRESGGCPNRRGGDIVDDNCNVVGHDGSDHRSDSGLLQINGVNYDKSRNKWALLCRELNICEQAPLLDAYTNLVAGKVLWDASGWDPWSPCSWGPDNRPAYCKN